MSIDDACESLTPAARVLGMYRTLADGDVMGLLGSLGSDIEWVVPAGLHHGGTHRGREAVLTNVFARFSTEWDGFTVDADEVLEAGDVVVALGHYRAANKATGSPMTSRFAHVWRFRDGVPVRFETILDTQAMVRTMAAAQP